MMFMTTMHWIFTCSGTIFSSKRLVEQTAHHHAGKEHIMHANGHTTVWGTHIGLGRATDGKTWYQQLKDWWTAHNAARQQAALARLRARWDARHEAVRPFRAEQA